MNGTQLSSAETSEAPRRWHAAVEVSAVIVIACVPHITLTSYDRIRRIAYQGSCTEQQMNDLLQMPGIKRQQSVQDNVRSSSPDLFNKW